MLKWIDPTNAANIRFAPLLLIPVSLERGNAGEKFKLRARPEEFASNLSLEAYLTGCMEFACPRLRRPTTLSHLPTWMRSPTRSRPSPDGLFCTMIWRLAFSPSPNF
jgi:hypothetical protein